MPSQRRRIIGRPIHRSGLLLHHLPAPAPDAAIKIVMKRGEIGMALARKAVLQRITPPALLQKAERIGIPRCRIEISGNGVVIERREEAHEVVDNLTAGRILAQNVGVQTIIGRHLIGAEALEVQPMCGIGFGDGQIWRIDLVESRDTSMLQNTLPQAAFSAPWRFVFRFQPGAKSARRVRAIVFNRVMAAIFIIGLPRDDAGMGAVTCAIAVTMRWVSRA
jgi:hypothetical protein